jgi:hypothetical protein
VYAATSICGCSSPGQYSSPEAVFRSVPADRRFFEPTDVPKIVQAGLGIGLGEANAVASAVGSGLGVTAAAAAWLRVSVATERDAGGNVDPPPEQAARNIAQTNMQNPTIARK